MNRFFLSTACLLATLLSASLAQAAGPSLSAPEALAEVKAGEITLIDVRTPGEWRQTGIPEGARQVTLDPAAGPDAFARAVLSVVQGDKDAPIAVICRTGHRSTHAQEELEAHGFTHVYNVREGMMGSSYGPGWLPRGLPTRTCKNC